MSAAVVGRRREREAVQASLDAGLHVLLEGPPGTSKSTLLRDVAAEMGQALFFVEGNAGLTPARLAGAHAPHEVLAHGYRDEDFVPGPLVEAMREGALLYIEELNRVPADTLNLLLGPLAEGRLAVARLGEVHAREGFRLIAAMNPFDHGAAPVSRAVLDRLVRLAVVPQPEDEERTIVAARTGSQNDWLIEGSVAVTRATRDHPELDHGASVRGAIDLVAVAERLAAHRDLTLRAREKDAERAVLSATLLALSGRVQVASCGRPAEVILRELFEDIFLLAPARAPRGAHVLDLENPVVSRRPPRPAPLGRVPARPVEQAPDVAPERAWPKAGEVKAAPAVMSAADVARALDRPAAIDRDAELQESQDALADLGGEGREDAERDSEEREEDLYERARRLAREILLRLPKRVLTANAGRGKLATIRYRWGSDDLDLDRTLEEIAGNPFPEAEDFWVHERLRARRAYALMLDVSGSMRGEQLVNAAVAAGALATAIDRDDLAVIAFWRDGAVLEPLSARIDTERLLRRVLSLPARGLTNLHLGLELGLRELSRASTRDRIGILFSDAGHNLGEDPLAMAARFQVLHVVAISAEPARVRACHDVASRGGGRCVLATSLEEIPAAINELVGA
ncbi:MAG TPA: AAA family ATPase [Solirubrobacteraceae bacterium]|nr:AAA family ATPase [Solirubrobacteraceae bacterium]